MPFTATVFNVLIASPSDVADERKKIAETINNWTVQNANHTKQVLVPIMWETSSVPLLENTDPQTQINKQLVQKCDILIGAFWSRIGSPTPRAPGGTVEEIQSFIGANKPALLYFCERDVPQKNINFDQLAELDKFKADIMAKNLVATYSSVEDLSTKLYQHISRVMQTLQVRTTVEVVYDEKQVGYRLVFNTKASFLVMGDLLKARRLLRGIQYQDARIASGEGLCFSNKRLKEVAGRLGIPAHIEPQP
jgi:hypothetical protein